MPNTKIPSDKLLIHATELRATGLSWAVIGRELNRKPESVQRWEELAPAKWRQFYNRAMKRNARDVTAESVTALRQDLRDHKDKKARRDSATKLLRYGMVALKPSAKKPTKKNAEGPTSAGVRFAKYVESLTPDQLSNLIRDLGYVRKEMVAIPSP